MAGEPQPRRGVALVIGVGQYAHGIPGLDHAVDDANALTELLTDTEVCRFPPNQVRVLTDEKASRDALVEHLSEWLPTQSQGAEIAVIYFAGHGMARTVGKKEEGFLLPHDADPLNPAVRGVAMSDLTKWVEGVRAESVVVFLDCCHAGLALKFRDTQRDVGIRPDAIRGMAGKGRFLMVACDEGQKSAEVTTLGHGLFTSHLLKGIAGAGDLGDDGKVGLSELFEYVANAVAEDTRKMGFEQRPWTEAVAAGNEFISWRRAGSTVGFPAPPGPNPPPPPKPVPLGDGPEAALKQIKERMVGADEPELVYLLRQAGKLADPRAVPVVVPYLAHAAEPVSAMAKRAVQALGIDRTFAAVEELARHGSPDLGPVLDGLAAFEARADLVRLLDQIVDHVGGELLVRATAILGRKRLGLGLEDMRALFRKNGSQYELRRVLGRGQYTAAYLAHDPDGDMEVVVRVLRAEFVPIPEVRKSFFAVCQQSLKLGSENLVKTLQARKFADEKAYYTVREHIAGVTLRDVLFGRPDAPGRRFAPLQVIEILRQLLSALRHVHANRVCHGSVKPSNIFICSGDRVVLGDLAPTLPVNVPGTDRRLAYNYRYTPPEIFSGDPVEVRADLYALGCVAYELFCGTTPFVSDRPHDLYLGHTTGTIPPARTHEPSLPPEIDGFLARLLARDPRARPTAEGALAQLDALRAALARPAPDRADPEFEFAREDVPTRGPPDDPSDSTLDLRPEDLEPAGAAPDTGTAKRAPIQDIFETDFNIPALPAPGPTLEPARPAGSGGTEDELLWAIEEDDGRSTDPRAPPVTLVRAESLAEYEIPQTRMTVGGDRPLAASQPDLPTPMPLRTGSGDGPSEPPADTAPLPSRIGRFEVQAVLGEGAFGRVYRGYDPALGRHVAIKIPHRRAITADFRERFLREARASAAIHHPNVCAIYEAGTDDDLPYLVMQYVAGGSLARFLGPDRKLLDPQTAVLIVRKLALGVAAAHAKGVVHRDLKPANVLYDASGKEVLITDFGIARIMSESRTTADDVLIGTPAYMSPEQVRGNTSTVGPLSDIYSLGVILYQLLTGRVPYQGEIHEVLIQVAEGNPIHPVSLRPELDPRLNTLCLKAMARDPSDRFASAPELASALWQYLRS